MGERGSSRSRVLWVTGQFAGDLSGQVRAARCGVRSHLCSRGVYQRFCLPRSAGPRMAGDVLVALTREEGKNGPLKSLLDQRDISSVEIPCIEHARLQGAQNLQQMLISESWDWVIVTSPEAAKVLLDEWVNAGAPDLKVAAVGTATATKLERAGIVPQFVPSKATGKTLAAELPVDVDRKPSILYSTSRRAGVDLQDGLTARGATVTRLNTYDTIASTLDAITVEIGRRVDVATFASPSSVEAWVNQIGLPALAACIGETSAQACKAKGIDLVYYPDKPGLEGWATSVSDAVAHIKRRA